MIKNIETTSLISQISIEAAIEEALLVADFFDRISHDENAVPLQLPLDSSLFEHLETAQKYMDVPVGVDELSELTVLLSKRG